MNLISGALFRSMISNGGLGLEKHRKEVNDLNVFPVPDGDTGTNMSLTMQGGIRAMASFSAGTSIGEFAQAMRQGMLLSARGNSGVILSQFFAGLAEGLKDLENAGIQDFLDAYKMGVERAYKVVVKPVEGTILTVIREGYEHVSKAFNADASFEDLFISLIQKMQETLQKTPEMLPVLKEAGVIDSGGAGLLYIIEGMASALNGDLVDIATLDGSTSTQGPLDFSLYNEDTKLDYGYCTEFILQLSNAKQGPEKFDLNALIEYLSTLGDSIVAFRDGNIVKVHVHTKTPDLAISYALKYGDFLTFKMENMTLQHEETMMARQGALEHPAEESVERVPVSCVAVSPSAGFTKQFKEYGVPVVIESTDLMNPDSNDFIRAFEQANADNIIVLPNNKNELMVAHQAAELYTKSWIYVLETTDIMKGMVAASILDLANLGLEDNLTRMEAALKKMSTVAIAKAVHPYRRGRLRVKLGDYIGIIDGTIMVSGQDVPSVFAKTLKAVPHIEDASCITVFTGDGLDASISEKLSASVEEIDSFIECCILEGGQKLYDLWCSVEF